MSVETSQLPMRNQNEPLWQRRESALLGSYATFSIHTKGRVFPEADHPYRGPFQRDRDRILHSAAFRRLSGKMQVFTGDMGDYHRTRLTHTHEVASIARTIGRQLRLNEDLIEALALLHDIGHPPYGHCGENVLNFCLRDFGGFSHNRFALELVEQLETRYTGIVGLNLSREVLAGQTHRIGKDMTAAIPSLEVQVVDAADSMAYDAHDVDDALQLGLLQLDQLMEIEFIKRCVSEQKRTVANAPINRQYLVHAMLETQVGHFLEQAQDSIKKCDGMTIAEIQQQQSVVLHLPSEIEQERRELEAFLFKNVYRHPKLIAVREQAAQRLQRLFEALTQNPERLPDRFQSIAKEIGLQKSVATYLAGMTDRFCEDSYAQLIDRGEQQALDWYAV